MPPYPPIADYAAIGCTRSVALISRGGSIDWLCWPRFDSASVFGRILDAEKGGFFAIRPSVEHEAKRRYLEGTNVIETTFTTRSGVARMLDLMPVFTEEEKQKQLSPFRQLLRRIEVIEGGVPIEIAYAPRPDYGRVTPRLEVRKDSIYCSWGARVLNLRSDARFNIDEGTATSRVTLHAGQSRTFALGFDDQTPAVLPSLDAASEIERTISFWRTWSSQLTYDGPYRDLVLRSVLVLKLLTYAPTGAIIAAPTTSLPEFIGGVRNWDYRYCWLRDASWTVSALYDCGFSNEGAAFLDWLLYSTRLTHPHLQMLYDVFGEAQVPEKTLDHLDGYRGSRPVRIGNDARSQFQLDVYGEVLGAVEEATRRGEKLGRDVQHLLRRLTEIVCERWREPDAGIWEKRGDPRQHVHGKVMAWSALDSAQRIASRGHMKIDEARVEKAKADIKEAVLRHGFDEKRNTFTGIFDDEEVDASLLFIARVGFIDPTDPRMLGTIDAIRTDLGHDGLIYRYDSRKTEDGLPPGEGVFLACTFWLVEALALAGRVDEARTLFDDVIRHSNDAGLFAEEIDAGSGELLGNFPQALSHIALLNAALHLEEASRKGKSEPRAQ
ncbi:MAG TPA: glycoside hydrolase family 15 protein [Thermoanaerobaculia bacterium]|jgi:GH15 family glucan-1,4-alpha-glucosidase|nr:glycoside hydrolase family 15 protein [Thermoanaerobaculia bacterium]